MRKPCQKAASPVPKGALSPSRVPCLAFYVYHREHLLEKHLRSSRPISVGTLRRGNLPMFRRMYLNMKHAFSCVAFTRTFNRTRTRLREANTLGCLNIACYIIWQGAEPVTCLNGRVRRRFSALIKIDQLTDRGLRRRCCNVWFHERRNIRARAVRVCANLTEIAFSLIRGNCLK